MKTAPRNTMITSDEVENKDVPQTTNRVEKKTFFFPSFGRSVAAETYEEALRIINNEEMS